MEYAPRRIDEPQEVTPEEFHQRITGSWLANIGGISQLAEFRFYAKRDWDIEAFSGLIVPNLDGPVDQTLQGKAQIVETVTSATITGLKCVIHHGSPCVVFDVQNCVEQGVMSSDIGEPWVETFRYDRPNWNQRYVYISGDSLIEAHELNSAGGIAFLQNGNLTILSREPFEIMNLRWSPSLGSIIAGTQ